MGQLLFSLKNMCIPNEAEVLIEIVIPNKPNMKKVIIPRKTSKGKRDLNL